METVTSHISNLLLETFRKAFETHKDVTGLIVHSDQGSQYTSHAHRDMLPKVGAKISMSRRGNCYYNASKLLFTFESGSFSILMISDASRKHKGVLKNSCFFTTKNKHKES
ncbi:DDE-type integrase/transposase/recombinase [Paenibacillus sp. NPDC056579]|uniref:DDE-type integrase/transposase/recombinase n=1 Tax=Paenibacillus sp. NPDC056579 TaxID=3345871 RepID=UPI00369FFB4C